MREFWSVTYTILSAALDNRRSLSAGIWQAEEMWLRAWFIHDMTQPSLCFLIKFVRCVTKYHYKSCYKLRSSTASNRQRVSHCLSIYSIASSLQFSTVVLLWWILEVVWLRHIWLRETYVVKTLESDAHMTWTELELYSCRKCLCYCISMWKNFDSFYME